MKFQLSMTTFPTFRAAALFTLHLCTIGRITSSRGVASAIAEFDLPFPLADLCRRTAQATHLWPSEKIEVARELASHFRDGLDAGNPADQLAQGFGTVRIVARLIRRAKKRARPFAWRAAIRTVQACALFLGAILALYGVLAVRFWSGSPTITRSFIREHNALADAIPKSDRAWPIYRQAVLARVATPFDLISAESTWPNIEPDDPHWPVAVEFIQRSQPSLSLVHQASRLPALGNRWTTSSDIEIDRHIVGLRGGRAEDLVATEDNPDAPLIGILLPHLGLFRNFARELSFDMRVAEHEGDRARVLRDAETLRGMAAHCRQEPTLVSGLVAFAILHLEIEQVGRLLARNPEFFSADDLGALSRAHADWGGPEGLRLSFASESDNFEDLLQRCYSDNGRGDGRLTPEGLEFLQSLTGGSAAPAWLQSSVRGNGYLSLVGPAIMQTIASRREQREKYSDLIALAEKDLQLPAWTRRKNGVAARAIEEIYSNRATRMKFFPVGTMFPAILRIGDKGDAIGASRDALLIAIACEAHRRQTGEYPTSLSALRLPVTATGALDPWDGAPLRMLLRDGRPLVYSVGPDETDNQGAASAARDNSALAPGSKAPGGGQDWILWPPAK
ncbi:hypothetical protein PHYC_03195 [Phycisphaerales bacterium]|nr:hypothetical protein PHYC_03195 [Phycisphaerales bacterium]